MKNNITLFLIVCFCSFCMLLNSTTYHIKQDGTGNFTTIQVGIDACVDSDTILVYPGTYFENLVIIEKAITLGSLYLTTGDESYISQTIIDGFENGCVIRIEDIPDWYEVYISGFVIQNGIGYQYNYPYSPDRVGGGIFVSESQITVKKCIAQYNKANESGGGIALANSTLYLSGSTIRFNHSDYAAGGLLIGYTSSSVSFDSEELNNIYLNYAGVGNDIFITHGSPYQEIIVDTFTVIDPAEGYYFVYPGSGGGGFPMPDHFSIDIQNAALDQVNSDLYVSPNGDNNNSGTSVAEPLQSIAFALAKIRSNSLFHKTIHIADGVYSPSLNYQCFPLHIKSYIDIVGESRDNTILDAELNDGLFRGEDPQSKYSIRNLSLINSRNFSDIELYENTDVEIENLLITGHQDDLWDTAECGISLNFNDIEINNIIIENNSFAGSVYFYSPKYSSEFKISNCIIRNNTPSTDYGCIQLFCYRSGSSSDSLIINILNTEITNNLDNGFEWSPRTSALLVDWNSKVNIINSTIGNNITLEQGAAVQLRDESEANVVNSIIYGNLPYQLCLNGTWGPNTLNANNSLIEGGIANILQIGYNYITWDDETMLDEDPLWLGPGAELPYALSTDSPCIDAGTLELPPGIELPEYDLAGNPRIVNGIIDMGAYEYQDSVSVLDNIQSSILNIQLSNYPNPFNPTTTIKLDHAESGKIELAIYNIKGQKIKTLMDAYSCKGHFEIIWRGTDENEKKVATGNYFAKLKVNGDIKAVRKLILLK